MLQRHPLLAYFVIAYTISWGGIAVLIATRVLRHSDTVGDLPVVFTAMVLGPSVSGILVTLLVDGRRGLHMLWQRLTKWRVAPHWFAIALATTPALLIPILFGLSSLFGEQYFPHFKPALFAVGLLAGLFEEIGWTGFAIPRLLAHARWPAAGLTLGLIWVAWHGFADFDANHRAMGPSWLIWLGVFWLAALPAYRILMTWVYVRTESALLGILMHAGYTGWLLVLSPDLPLMQGLIWQGAFAVALWACVAIVVMRPTPQSAKTASERNPTSSGEGFW